MLLPEFASSLIRGAVAAMFKVVSGLAVPMPINPESGSTTNFEVSTVKPPANVEVAEVEVATKWSALTDDESILRLFIPLAKMSTSEVPLLYVRYVSPKDNAEPLYEPSRYSFLPVDNRLSSDAAKETFCTVPLVPETPAL